MRFLRDIIIQILDWFYRPFSKFIPVETFRYAATGGINTVFDIFLYFIFYTFIFSKEIVDFGLIAMGPHIAAFVFVFPITFSTGFLLAKYVTFTRSFLRGRVQLFRYGLSVGGSILLNYFFLKLFVESFMWDAVFSKVVTTFIVILYSYLVQKHFTFKTGKKALNRHAEKEAFDKR